MYSAVSHFLRRFRGRDHGTKPRDRSRHLHIEPLEGRRLLAQTTGLLVHNEAEAYEGFTLFNPHFSGETYLIDNEGDVIQRWKSDYTPGLMGYLLPDGSLLRSGRPRGGPDSTINAIGGGGRLEWRSFSGDLLWDFRYDTNSHLAHHDIEPIFNPDGSLGSVLMIAWERKTVTQANRAGRDPSLRFNKDGQIYPDHVIEVKPILNAAAGQPDFEIVWEWHVWDHLIQDFNPRKDNYGVVADHPELIDINKLASGEGQGANPSLDWLHTNGVSYHPDFDLLVLSVRHFSEFWVIDHSTTQQEAASHTGGNFGKGGDLLYRWGNPDRYEAGPPRDQTMWVQHDATWVFGDDPSNTSDDRIVVFDNGLGRPGKDFSATLEIPVPEIVAHPDANVQYMFRFQDPQYYGPRPDNHVSVYDGPPRHYAPVISGSHRLPNGNTLITPGTSGTLVEVNENGQVVWEYVNRWLADGPIGPTTPLPPGLQGSRLGSNAVFKARRYGEEYFDFTADPKFNRDDLHPDHHDTVGVVNPNNWQWILADHVGGSTDGNTSFRRGGKAPSSWLPLTGDWDGDGRDSVGLYNPHKNKWLLFGDTKANGVPQEAVQIIAQPRAYPKWLPVTGDWDGDGRDSPALYNPANGRWWLNNRTTSTGANELLTFVMNPKPAQHFQPLAGDWDGDGIDTVGFYNNRANVWHLYNHYDVAAGKFEPPAAANRELFRTPWSGSTGQPIVGDWDGDEKDSVGLYNPRSSRWYFNNRNQTAGVNEVDIYQTPRAPASWLPLAGNWDGSGTGLVLDTRTSRAAPPEAAATLTQQQASELLDAALARWSDSDIGPSWLAEIEVSVVDLAGHQLGRAVGTSRIELDVNAAGIGWFVDVTPHDDLEYRATRDKRHLRARPGSDAKDRVDLWTVLLHEIGHLRGEQHEENGLMQASLPAGARRLQP